MKNELFKQFLELVQDRNHEHCERTFVSKNGKMFYQPYGFDHFYRGSNLNDNNEWLSVFMAEKPLELDDCQKKAILDLDEFVYES